MWIEKCIEQRVLGQTGSDGAGVKLRRILTSEHHQRLDPWLMLDEFGSDKADDYIAGFPPHPHRGFETITYMLAGRMEHQDNRGHKGVVEAGGVQWMCAGKGIIHSEMPAQEAGLMRGFQFWLNLPSEQKMSEPDWADIAHNAIPVLSEQGHHVNVIAGTFAGLIGPIQREVTQPRILDVVVDEAKTLRFDITLGHHAYCYVYDGVIDVGEMRLQAAEMGILSQEGNEFVLTAQANTRFLLVSGKPLNQPIVTGGPFVMNSESEIRQAFSDYRAGRF
jgi:redox-sensitive bicupin YhaK (pirin superfamily)